MVNGEEMHPITFQNIITVGVGQAGEELGNIIKEI